MMRTPRDFLNDVHWRLLDSMSPELKVAYLMGVEFVYEHTLHENGSLTLTMRPKHKLSFEYDESGVVKRIIVSMEIA